MRIGVDLIYGRRKQGVSKGVYPFGSGSSNRGEERPVGWGFQRGQRSLGGRHPMEGSALKWQEESNETGGFVAHDLVCKV